MAHLAGHHLGRMFNIAHSTQKLTNESVSILLQLPEGWTELEGIPSALVFAGESEFALLLALPGLGGGKQRNA